MHLICCNFSLLVLLLIRKSIASMRRHVERMTDRLPVYHDDEGLSTNSATSPARQSTSTAGGAHSKDGMDGMSSGVGSGTHLLTPQHQQQQQQPQQRQQQHPNGGIADTAADFHEPPPNIQVVGHAL